MKIRKVTNDLRKVTNDFQTTYEKLRNLRKLLQRNFRLFTCKVYAQTSVHLKSQRGFPAMAPPGRKRDTRLQYDIDVVSSKTGLRCSSIALAARKFMLKGKRLKISRVETAMHRNMQKLGQRFRCV